MSKEKEKCQKKEKKTETKKNGKKSVKYLVQAIDIFLLIL